MDPISKFYVQFQTEEYLINCVRIGEGPQPIFAFSGIMAPMKSSFVPLLLLMEKNEEFLRDFTFYGWDQPGYFGSRPPRRSMNDISFTKDVEIGRTLLQTLSTKKFIILGYSGGAQIALLFAMKYPEMVRKLFLWGAWDRFEEEDIKLNKWYRELENVAGPFSSLLREDFEGETELMLQHWTAWHDMVLKEYGNKDKDAWNERFTKISCPTLILWGKRDMIVPFRQVKDLHAAIPNSRLIVMEKAPHNAHFMFPAEFFKILISFLNETD